MKLVLFAHHPGDARAGLLTERGILDASKIVPRAHTPQLTMQGIIDGFESASRSAEELATSGAPPTNGCGAAAGACASTPGKSWRASPTTGSTRSASLGR